MMNYNTNTMYTVLREIPMTKFSIWWNKIFQLWCWEPHLKKGNIIPDILYPVSWFKVLILQTFWNLFSFCWTYSTQEFSAGPSEFLPNLHFLCKIVLKPSNVIPLLLKIGRPVTIQNKPKSWNHAPKKSSKIQLEIPSNLPDLKHNF